ncbi:MAG TPA: ABC transporter permease [Jiangellales bacterium]|nr:ABC transporter permease [Jiangellales bacterium]
MTASLTALSDVAAMTGRTLRITVRQPENLLLGVVLPVMITLVFVTAFGGAIEAATGGEYITYVVPGVILLCAGYGAANTAVGLVTDAGGPFLDRFRSLPVAPSSLLWAHGQVSLVRNLTSTAVVVTVALLLGFRSAAGPTAWLAVVGLVTAYVAAISAVAVFIGVVVRSAEAAGGFAFAMLFLPYVSSAFVPVRTLPSWLAPVAEHQPVTPTTEAIRSLLQGTPVGSHAWTALAWTTTVTVVFATAAAWVFRRRGR